MVEETKQKHDIGTTTSLFSLLSHADIDCRQPSGLTTNSRRKNSLLPKKEWSNLSYKRNLFTLCADNYEEEIDLGMDPTSSSTDVSGHSKDEMSLYCTRPYKRQRRSHHLVGLPADLASITSSDNKDLPFPTILNENRKEGCRALSNTSCDDNAWGFFTQ